MTQVTENWLTRKPQKSALTTTFILTGILLMSGFIFLSDLFRASEWMPADANNVFVHLEIWRLWTALFAHANLGHLMNNSLMFLPLAYLLTSYFNLLLFPFVGLLIGGLINLIVLYTLPPETSIIGVSGVVYWMGSAWLTLFLLIDSRKTLRRRIAISLFLTVVLFAPQTYEQGISYLSHLLGYLFGIMSGIVYFCIYRKIIRAAEVLKVVEEPEDLILRADDVQLQEPGTSKSLW